MRMAPSANSTYQKYEIDDSEKQVSNHYHDPYHGKDFAQRFTKGVMSEHIEDLDLFTCEPGDANAFFVADMGHVYRQHLRWKKNLPRVKPHYAVKCNPDPEVLRLLAELDTSFDCASMQEIQMALDVGVDPSRIIYAQSGCKEPSHMRFAAKQGVKQMTFDNADELYKTKAVCPDAEIFIRILTDDSASLCRLGDKYGVALESTTGLLTLAKELDLNVVGVSFHIGSGASDPQSFAKSVVDARTVFDQAAEIGFELKTLDIGGGFTGDLFEEMADTLSRALDEHFSTNVRIIAEPGRYYVASAFTLACCVIGRRLPEPALKETSYRLYLNDGVYGNFNSKFFDHQIFTPHVLSRYDSSAQSTDYSVWGPTCDGIDLITPLSTMPGVLRIGDWLYFENMGAYTKCCATRFNGLPNNHEVIYISSEPGASALLNYDNGFRMPVLRKQKL